MDLPHWCVHFLYAFGHFKQRGESFHLRRDEQEFSYELFEGATLQVLPISSCRETFGFGRTSEYDDFSLNWRHWRSNHHRVEYMTPPSQAINSWLTVNTGTNRYDDKTWTWDLRIYVQHSYLLTFWRWPFITYKTFSNELCDHKFNSNKKT